MHCQRTSFGIRFASLSRRWRRYIDQQLALHGINDATWAPLIHLANLGNAVNQKQLAEAIGIEGPAQVRLLDMLEKRGHIERRSSSTDRRNKLIFLSDEGLEKAHEIRAHLKQIEKDFLSQISDEQLSCFHAVLDQVELRLQK